MLVEFAIGLCLSALVTAQSDPVVELSLGKIRGSILQTVTGKNFYAFRGIKYAQPPIGDKRFRAPVAVTKWNRELDATKDGPFCPQKNKNYTQSEDCLHLNVYTRNLTGNSAVLVYIHGGGHKQGGSHSIKRVGPNFLMDADIVMVSMNYRFGALGFLSTRTKEAPGNYGFLDQVMSLEWVQEHIPNFGGNPKEVTIFGHSVGAMYVTGLLASPLTRDLFQRAIAMDGSLSNHHAIDNLYWTRLLAHYAGCPKYNPSDLVECLRKVPADKIIEICKTWEPYKLVDFRWNYEIDGYFLPQHPSVAFARGDFQRVPILTGSNRDEFKFRFFSKENRTGLFNDISLNFGNYGPEIFFSSPDDPTGLRDNKVQTFYLGNKNINEQNLTNLGDLVSDAAINHGIHRLVQLTRRYVDVFYYRFDYLGRYGFRYGSDNKPLGVLHADDVQYYIISDAFEANLGPGDPEWFMVERMVGYITSFVINGSPRDVNGVKWLPSNRTNVYTLYINEDVTLGDEPIKERFQLWDDLFPVFGNGTKNTNASVIFVFAALLCLVFTK